MRAENTYTPASHATTIHGSAPSNAAPPAAGHAGRGNGGASGFPCAEPSAKKVSSGAAVIRASAAQESA